MNTKSTISWGHLTGSAIRICQKNKGLPDTKKKLGFTSLDRS